MNGFLIIDKPTGRTSFSVLAEVRKKMNGAKIGHLGTLDPLATGVLVLAIGEATKLVEYMMSMEKTYEVEAVFGAISSTYDADGQLTEQILPNDFDLGADQIEKKIDQKFSSKIMQVPPAYSAKWVDGKRAYQLARKGRDVALPPNEVEVFSFDLKSFSYPFATFEVDVSSGTYVRSLIHDIGQEFGCGAYVNKLRRTKVGDFTIADAFNFGDDEEINLFVEVEKLVNKKFVRVDLDDVEFDILKVGRKLDNRRALKSGLYSGYYKDVLYGLLRVNELPLPGWIKFEKRFHL